MKGVIEKLNENTKIETKPSSKTESPLPIPNIGKPSSKSDPNLLTDSQTDPRPPPKTNSSLSSPKVEVKQPPKTNTNPKIDPRAPSKMNSPLPSPIVEGRPSPKMNPVPKIEARSPSITELTSYPVPKMPPPKMPMPKSKVVHTSTQPTKIEKGIGSGKFNDLKKSLMSIKPKIPPPSPEKSFLITDNGGGKKKKIENDPLVKPNRKAPKLSAKPSERIIERMTTGLEKSVVVRVNLPIDCEIPFKMLLIESNHTSKQVIENLEKKLSDSKIMIESPILYLKIKQSDLGTKIQVLDHKDIVSDYFTKFGVENIQIFAQSKNSKLPQRNQVSYRESNYFVANKLAKKRVVEVHYNEDGTGSKMSKMAMEPDDKAIDFITKICKKKRAPTIQGVISLKYDGGVYIFASEDKLYGLFEKYEQNNPKLIYSDAHMLIAKIYLPYSCTSPYKSIKIDFESTARQIMQHTSKKMRMTTYYGGTLTLIPVGNSDDPEVNFNEEENPYTLFNAYGKENCKLIFAPSYLIKVLTPNSSLKPSVDVVLRLEMVTNKFIELIVEALGEKEENFISKYNPVLKFKTLINQKNFMLSPNDKIYPIISQYELDQVILTLNWKNPALESSILQSEEIIIPTRPLYNPPPRNTSPQEEENDQEGMDGGEIGEQEGEVDQGEQEGETDLGDQEGETDQDGEIDQGEEIEVGEINQGNQVEEIIQADRGERNEGGMDQNEMNKTENYEENGINDLENLFKMLEKEKIEGEIKNQNDKIEIDENLGVSENETNKQNGEIQKENENKIEIETDSNLNGEIENKGEENESFNIEIILQQELLFKMDKNDINWKKKWIVFTGDDLLIFLDKNSEETEDYLPITHETNVQRGFHDFSITTDNITWYFKSAASQIVTDTWFITISDHCEYKMSLKN